MGAEAGRDTETGIRSYAKLLQMKHFPKVKLPTFQGWPDSSSLPNTCTFASLWAAGRRLRINGVAEDTRERVVDVSHHVVQLVLSLQS